MGNDISKENAQQIVIEYLKQKKNTEKIDVSTIEQDHQDWVIRGTCPIDMEGHPWAEKFEVVIDTKGKIKCMYSSLL